MDTNWIAWAAGLFEGEGSLFWVQQIRRNNNKYYFYTRMQLKMTDEDVVRKFMDVLNVGYINYRKSEGPRRKEAWNWQLTNKEDCKKVIEMFWPYLGERRRAKAIEIGLHEGETI